MLAGMGLWNVDQSDARNARRNFSQHLQPLSPNCWLVGHEPRDVAARPRYALNEAEANWIVGVHEHNRDGARRLLQCRDRWRSVAKNDIWFQAYEFCGIMAEAVQISGRPTIIDPDVVALAPAQPL